MKTHITKYLAVFFIMSLLFLISCCKKEKPPEFNSQEEMIFSEIKIGDTTTLVSKNNNIIRISLIKTEFTRGLSAPICEKKSYRENSYWFSTTLNQSTTSPEKAGFLVIMRKNSLDGNIVSPTSLAYYSNYYDSIKVDKTVFKNVYKTDFPIYLGDKQIKILFNSKIICAIDSINNLTFK